MNTQSRNSLRTSLFAAIVFSVAASFSYAAQPAKQQPVYKGDIKSLGLTDDQKYNRTNLKGDLDDLNWTAGNSIYSANDLMRVLPFIDEKDVKDNKYQCDVVCKDRTGAIVGVSPDYKKFYKK